MFLWRPGDTEHTCWYATNFPGRHVSACWLARIQGEQLVTSAMSCAGSFGVPGSATRSTTRGFAMTEFIEIDFVEAGDKGSGDAIAIRYSRNNLNWIYVVDGGYADDGRKLVDHIRDYYDDPPYIDHVVLTHPDTDHASGLTTVLEQYRVSCLWMNRPWQHVDALMPMFERYQNRDRLIARLKRDFSKAAELEEIANDKGIEIKDAFRGARIGQFTVLSPSRSTYLKLVVESDKTPVAASDTMAKRQDAVSTAAWGEENLKGDTEGTTADNETSIVQFADVCDRKVLLTGDAGVRALAEAHEAATAMGKSTSNLDWFQVPHHGSRRNLSSDVLDTWLGVKLSGPVKSPIPRAIISANQKDKDHPKKAVVRALIHRGRRVIQTDGILQLRTTGAPDRPSSDWTSVTPLEYPAEQED